jgi:hypothetical protein
MLWDLLICQSWSEENDSVEMVLVAWSQGDVGIGGDITCGHTYCCFSPGSGFRHTSRSMLYCS